MAYFPANWYYHEKYHAQKRLNNILKNCLLSAAAQLHRPLSWLCFQMYALLLLQLMDHRKQVTRLGIPFRPEHPYETHARLLLLSQLIHQTRSEERRVGKVAR